MIPRAPVPIALLLIVFAAFVGQAASPVFWSVSTQAEFLEGDAENISIDANGHLRIGPGAETIHDAEAPFLWAVVRADDALWVAGGSGGEAGGLIRRIGPDDDVETPWRESGFDVHALAPRNDGGVYAATSPDGQVIAIDRDGVSSDWFDPEETYVWALTTLPDGTLFVGTGNPGRIYRVAPDGAASLLYDTGATHVRALAIDSAGRLLAGAGSPGHLFRIDLDGEAFVLLDSGREEIVSIRVSEDDVMLVTAAGQTSETGGSRSGTAASVASAASATTAGSAASAIGNSDPGGAVYRIGPDGVWDILWESTEATPYDAVRDAGGGVVIGTGPDGKLFRVAGEPPGTVLLTNAQAQQVTRFAAEPDGLIAWTTANPGAVYRMAPTRAGAGTYLSAVHDAETIASWGMIRWRATTPDGSSIHLQTRSGNTATPGDTWSAWSDAYDTPDGAAITSPRARYLQWRAELRSTGDTPILRSVTAAYLPRNLAPEITQLTLHEPGRVYQQSAAAGDPPIAGLNGGRDPAAPPTGGAATSTSTSLGRQVYRKGLRAFAWEASDPNDDALRYEVRYRAETEDTWRVLARDVTERLFTWDTTSTPDGTYVVRIVASDATANAPADALTGARDTAPFDVDNTPPQIAAATPDAPAGGETVVRVTVTDAQSAVTHVEYTLDAETWQVVYPIDGIPDGREETFEVTVPDGALDRLVVRATDGMNNTSTAGIR